jgi:hypothetical protein
LKPYSCRNYSHHFSHLLQPQGAATGDTLTFASYAPSRPSCLRFQVAFLLPELQRAVVFWSVGLLACLAVPYRQAVVCGFVLFLPWHVAFWATAGRPLASIVAIVLPTAVRRFVLVLLLPALPARWKLAVRAAPLAHFLQVRSCPECLLRLPLAARTLQELKQTNENSSVRPSSSVPSKLRTQIN